MSQINDEDIRMETSWTSWLVFSLRYFRLPFLFAAFAHKFPSSVRLIFELKLLNNIVWRAVERAICLWRRQPQEEEGENKTIRRHRFKWKWIRLKFEEAHWAIISLEKYIVPLDGNKITHMLRGFLCFSTQNILRVRVSSHSAPMEVKREKEKEKWRV